MKYRIAFICTGNSCRSQMAEGWSKELGSEFFEAYSAGTHPTAAVNPSAIEVMKDAGVDISTYRPKLLDEIPQEVDILVTMGCGVECPSLPASHREDWGLEDPVGQSLDVFRQTRDLIKSKMKDLINRVHNGTL